MGLVQAERAKDTAEKRLAQIERGIDILDSLFTDLDPRAEEKDGLPLRAILGERLDRAVAALEGEAVGDPLVVAQLQDRLGQTYLGLGHADKAEAMFTKAIAIRRAHLGADNLLTLDSRHNQALAYDAAGKRLEAIERFEQVLGDRVKVLGADHLDTLSTLHELATTYVHIGKPTEAIPLLEQVRDGQVKQLGEDHERTLVTLQNLSAAYHSTLRPTEAIALAEQVWHARVRKHGEDHREAISAMLTLAGAYKGGYKMKPALDLIEQARDRAMLKLGPYHPLTLRVLYSLAHTYRAYGRTNEAIALFEQVRERQVMTLGAYHPSTLVTLEGLALAYQDEGKLNKAVLALHQAAVGVERLKFADESAGNVIRNLCDCLERLRKYDEAEVWWRKWVSAAKEKYGAESVEYAGTKGLAGLGVNLLRQKKYADAELILRESLNVQRKKQPEDWATFHTQSLLGGALLGQQKYAEAESHLVQGYAEMKKAAKSRGDRHVRSTPPNRLNEALARLVELYDAWGKPAEAAKWRKELENDPSVGTQESGKKQCER
jgi:tetratricopeptide (TPR) repeat protein